MYEQVRLRSRFCTIDLISDSEFAQHTGLHFAHPDMLVSIGAERLLSIGCCRFSCADLVAWLRAIDGLPNFDSSRSSLLFRLIHDVLAPSDVAALAELRIFPSVCGLGCPPKRVSLLNGPLFSSIPDDVNYTLASGAVSVLSDMFDVPEHAAFFESLGILAASPTDLVDAVIQQHLRCGLHTAEQAWAGLYLLKDHLADYLKRPVGERLSEEMVSAICVPSGSGDLLLASELAVGTFLGVPCDCVADETRGKVARCPPVRVPMGMVATSESAAVESRIEAGILLHVCCRQGGAFESHAGVIAAGSAASSSSGTFFFEVRPILEDMGFGVTVSESGPYAESLVLYANGACTPSTLSTAWKGCAVGDRVCLAFDLDRALLFLAVNDAWLPTTTGPALEGIAYLTDSLPDALAAAAVQLPRNLVGAPLRPIIVSSKTQSSANRICTVCFSPRSGSVELAGFKPLAQHVQHLRLAGGLAFAAGAVKLPLYTPMTSELAWEAFFCSALRMKPHIAQCKNRKLWNQYWVDECTVSNACICFPPENAFSTCSSRASFADLLSGVFKRKSTSLHTLLAWCPIPSLSVACQQHRKILLRSLWMCSVPWQLHQSVDGHSNGVGSDLPRLPIFSPECITHDHRPP